MWLSKIGDSSLRMTGMGIKTDSKMSFKLGNKIGVNIDLEIWTGSQIWDRSHIPHWVQFHKNENLPIYQWNFQKYEIGQVHYDDHKRLVIQFHNGLALNPILTREKAWIQVKNTSVNIESGNEIELPSWGLGS